MIAIAKYQFCDALKANVRRLFNWPLVPRPRGAPWKQHSEHCQRRAPAFGCRRSWSRTWWCPPQPSETPWKWLAPGDETVKVGWGRCESESGWSKCESEIDRSGAGRIQKWKKLENRLDIMNVNKVKMFTFVGLTPERSRPMRRSMQLRIITVRTWRKKGGSRRGAFYEEQGARFLWVNSDELVVLDGSVRAKEKK